MLGGLCHRLSAAGSCVTCKIIKRIHQCTSCIIKLFLREPCANLPLYTDFDYDRVLKPQFRSFQSLPDGVKTYISLTGGPASSKNGRTFTTSLRDQVGAVQLGRSEGSILQAGRGKGCAVALQTTLTATVMALKLQDWAYLLLVTCLAIGSTQVRTCFLSLSWLFTPHH